MRHLALCLLATLLSATSARAEPWYRGPRGHHRVVHLSIVGATAVVYAGSELLKPELAASTCRWCSTNSFDRSVRDSVKWQDTSLAAALSNADGFAIAPLFAVTLTALGARDGGTGGILDDTVPLVESALLGQLVVQGVKFAAGRQRPFVHFGHTPADPDDNVSFFSAHSAFTFALATGGGLLAHRRGSAYEPYVWTGGYALAAAAGYLRIAADKHYASDVLVGAAFGTATGFLAPWLADQQLDVVPTGHGVALAGRF